MCLLDLIFFSLFLTMDGPVHFFPQSWLKGIFLFNSNNILYISIFWPCASYSKRPHYKLSNQSKPSMPRFRVQNQQICQSLRIMIVRNWKNSRNPNSVNREKQRRYVWTTIYTWHRNVNATIKSTSTNKCSVCVWASNWWKSVNVQFHMHLKRQVFGTCSLYSHIQASVSLL